MKRITALLIPLGTIVLFALAFRDFFTSSMLAYGDLAPFPESASQALQAYFSAWQPISRGSSLPYSLVLLEEGLLVGLTGENSLLAQKLYYLIPIPLSFLSMHYFLNRMTTTLLQTCPLSRRENRGSGILPNLVLSSHPPDSFVSVSDLL